MKLPHYIGLAVALSLGNFQYQFITAHDWTLASERSYFQTVAIMAVYLLNKIYK